MMTKAKRTDKNRVIELLCLSFANNLSVGFIIGSADGWDCRLRQLMSYAFDVCYRFGRVLLTEDGSACALLLYPPTRRFSLYRLWLDIRLVFEVIGPLRLTEVLRREKMIEIQHPSGPFCYLWFIGVEPKSQGRGVGSSLMAALIAKMDEEGLPVYLETSVERNIYFYGKFGFEVFHQIDLGYPLIFLKRSLRSFRVV